MKPEQIAKCAAALGITVEEFTKTYVEGDALEKGKKGLAALHAHLKKAVSLHEKMHAMHKTMAEHHASMAEHLDNCMKAHGACQDGDEAEKVAKELMAKAAESKAEEKASGITAEDVDKKIGEAVTKALDEFKKSLPAVEKTANVRTIGRDSGEVAKAATAGRALEV